MGLEVQGGLLTRWRDHPGQTNVVVGESEAPEGCQPFPPGHM